MIYGIVGCGDREWTATIAGVDGQPVFLVSGRNNLAAVVSKTGQGQGRPDVRQLIQYHQVIERLCNERTIIPMRYGCPFETVQQVEKLLHENSDHYQSLLAEVDGCVEMGISILSEPVADSPATDLASPGRQVATLPVVGQSPGHDYLSSLMSRCGERGRSAGEVARVSQSCRSAFAGLFVKSLDGIPQTGRGAPQLHCLYFLVPRESLAAFQQVYRQVSRNGSDKLLLSGPWPPYNFVMAGSTGNQQGEI